VKLGQDGGIVVLGVVPGSPADEAGIEPGDLILAIDDESTSGMNATEAALKMRGEQGTNVTLMVRHQDGEDIPALNLMLTRGTIDISTWWQGFVDDDIAYIDIDYFSDQTDDQLHSALEGIQGDDVAGIVLDLRDNPGGMVNAAAEVADQFLEENATILWLVYGDGSKETLIAESGGLAEDLKVALLVNWDTGSAAEMVAGALQDNERACLIGTQTYGKGCMQVICELSDGSAVFITSAYWYTPDRYLTGEHLTEGHGLTPDPVFQVEDNPATPADEQLEAAIDYILGP
jgi:carboxyl-terminal processing protease